MDEDNWEPNSMLEFDHYQNIARAAFGDMLYDNDRVNPYFFYKKKTVYISICMK